MTIARRGADKAIAVAHHETLADAMPFDGEPTVHGGFAVSVERKEAEHQPGDIMKAHAE
jgi:hypothetical protein